jgi:hypothetical protein
MIEEWARKKRLLSPQKPTGVKLSARINSSAKLSKNNSSSPTLPLSCLGYRQKNETP